MRFAIIGSVLSHVSAAVGITLFVTMPKPVDVIKTDSIAVSLVNMHAISSNVTSTINNSAAQDSSLSGARKIVEPTKPVVLEPVKTEALEPKTERQPSTKKFEKISPRKTNSIRSLQPREVLDHVEAPSVLVANKQQISPNENLDIKPAFSVKTFERTQTASLAIAVAQKTFEPTENMRPTPAPRPTSLKRTGVPTVFKKPVVTPQKKRQITKDRQQKAPTSKVGNGGKSNANSRAGAASNSRSVANYPGKVVSKLRRALRSPSGARNKSGEAHVKFVVAANGHVSSVRIAKSSGDKKLDAAALATVKRANPFPSIPQEAKRSSWAFTVPLLFQKR